MHNDLNEMEYIELFLGPIKKMKFDIDELNKMLEARIEVLMKHLSENDTASSFKTVKQESFRCIDGANSLCQKTYNSLIDTLQKSFYRIEENIEDKKN